MNYFLIVERYVPASKVYVELCRSTLSNNDIVYPDMNGALNRLLAYTPAQTFECYSGVEQADGWSYFKSKAIPAPAGFPVVTLPENDQTFPDVVTIPADYEIRAKVIQVM